jgi:hypothetical protein
MRHSPVPNEGFLHLYDEEELRKRFPDLETDTELSSMVGGDLRTAASGRLFRLMVRKGDSAPSPVSGRDEQKAKRAEQITQSLDEYLLTIC